MVLPGLMVVVVVVVLVLLGALLQPPPVAEAWAGTEGQEKEGNGTMR